MKAVKSFVPWFVVVRCNYLSFPSDICGCTIFIYSCFKKCICWRRVCVCVVCVCVCGVCVCGVCVCVCLCVCGCVAQQPKSGLGSYTVKVSRWHINRQTDRQTHTHTHTHTQYGRNPQTSDQLVAETATYTKHNKRKSRISMPLAGFEPAIPAIERSQTYA